MAILKEFKRENQKEFAGNRRRYNYFNLMPSEGTDTIAFTVPRSIKRTMKKLALGEGISLSKYMCLLTEYHIAERKEIGDL